jgi:hypothetical protein
MLYSLKALFNPKAFRGNASAGTSVVTRKLGCQVFLFPEFINSLLDHFSALDAWGKKAEAEGRGHKLVEELEHSVPVLGGATPSRAP